MGAQQVLISENDPNWKAPEMALTPLSLMSRALELGQVEQLQILQEMHFKQQTRDAEIEFNMAMNAVQAEIGRIAPDLNNPQTSTKYASYKALDKVLRPVYTKHGLSLSFSEEDCPKAEHVRIICYVSKGLHTRIYRKDMPVDNKGIKGNVMMTPTHATGAADSYGKRYLLKDIFNVAIGEDDTDGNAPSGPEMEGLDDWCTKIIDASNYEEMDAAFRPAWTRAGELKSDSAKNALSQARDAWRKRKAGR